jgi:hypothetical protein
MRQGRLPGNLPNACRIELWRERFMFRLRQLPSPDRSLMLSLALFVMWSPILAAVLRVNLPPAHATLIDFSNAPSEKCIVLRFSGDAAVIAAIHSDPSKDETAYSMRIWRTADARLSAHVDLGVAAPLALALCALSQELAIATDDGLIRVFDWRDGQQIGTYQRDSWSYWNGARFHQEGCLPVLTYDEQGRLLEVTLCNESTIPILTDVEIVDVKRARVLARLEPPRPIQWIRTQFGSLLMGSDNEIRAWKIGAWQTYDQYWPPAAVNDIAWCMNRSTLLANLKTPGLNPRSLLVWESRDGEVHEVLVNEPTEQDRMPMRGWLQSRPAQFNADGSAVALEEVQYAPAEAKTKKVLDNFWLRDKCGNLLPKHRIRIIELPGGRPLGVIPDVELAEFSQGGAYLAATGYEGTVSLYEIPLKTQWVKILTACGGMIALMTFLVWLCRRLTLSRGMDRGKEIGREETTM